MSNVNSRAKPCCVALARSRPLLARGDGPGCRPDGIGVKVGPSAPNGPPLLGQRGPPPDWIPTTVGADFALPPTLQPLAPFQDQLSVLSGLSQDASFLTGAHPRKTDDADIKAGISVDQPAAQMVGRSTKFSSLELGCERGTQSGNCNLGYSCAYSSNISRSSESIPVVKEINTRLAFERLFSNGVAGEQGVSRVRRERYRASILDFGIEEARQLPPPQPHRRPQGR